MKGLFPSSDIAKNESSPERRLLAAVMKTAIDDIRVRRYTRAKTDKKGTSKIKKIDNSRLIEDSFEFLLDRIYDIHSIYGIFDIPRDRMISYLRDLRLNGRISWIPSKYSWIMDDGNDIEGADERDNRRVVAFPLDSAGDLAHRIDR